MMIVKGAGYIQMNLVGIRLTSMFHLEETINKRIEREAYIKDVIKGVIM